MFIVALFIIDKNEKQSRCPSTGKWTNKMWNVNTFKYHSAIGKKKRKILIYAITRMYLKDMLSEESQIPKNKNGLVPVIRIV